MATEQELIGALRQADAAGDTAAATRFAEMIKEQRTAAAPYQAAPGFEQAGPSVGGVTIERPVQQPPARPGYDKALGDARAEVTAANGPTTDGQGRLGGLIKGAMLGFDDELWGAGAAAKVGLANLVGQGPGYGAGEAYDAGRAALNEQSDTFAKAHPVQNIASSVAGGFLTPGVGALAGWAGGAPTLATGVGRGALMGAGLGGAAGAGNAEGGLEARAKGGAKGAALGAAVGGLVPVAARGVGAAIGAGQRALAPPAVAGLSRKANQVLADVIDPAATQRVQQLGPEAMLVDAGPSAVGVAQGVATRPSAGRDALVQALTARNQGANARLGADVEGAIGPNVVPSQVEAGFQAARRALSPQYEQALSGSGPVDLTSAMQVLERDGASAKGGIATALQNVRGMFEGADGQIDNTAQGALSIRQALDDMIGGTQGNERRILSALRQEVSGALSEAAPNIGAIDQQYAGLMRQSEALETGQQVLDSGRTAIRPQELADAMAANAPETNTALRQGTRAEIDRLMGTKANDLVALRNVVKGEGDWNRARLAQVFGQAEADRVIGAVDREAAFASAYNRLTQNSETASRQGGAKFLEEQSPVNIRQTPQTLMGAGVEGAHRLAEAVLGNRNRSATDALANELGPVLVARGAERDALVRQILAGHRRTAASRLNTDQARRLSEYLLQGAGRGTVGLGDRSKAPADSRPQ